MRGLAEARWSDYENYMKSFEPVYRCKCCGVIDTWELHAIARGFYLVCPNCGETKHVGATVDAVKAKRVYREQCN